MNRWTGVALLLALGVPAWAVDVNTASKEELEAAGFSADDAGRIVEAREQSGPFSSSKDLLKIEGVTQGDLNRVRADVTVDGQRITTRSGTAPAIPGVSRAIPNDRSVAHRAGEPENEQEGAEARQDRGRGHDSAGGRGEGRSGGDSGGRGGDDKGGDDRGGSGKGGSGH